MSGLEDFRRKLLSPDEYAEETLKWLQKHPGAKVIIRYFSQYGLVPKITAYQDLESLSAIVRLTGVCNICGENFDVSYRQLIDGLRERSLIQKEKSMGGQSFLYLTQEGRKYLGIHTLPEEKSAAIERLTSELERRGVEEGKLNIIRSILSEISEKISIEEVSSECEKIKNSVSI